MIELTKVQRDKMIIDFESELGDMVDDALANGMPPDDITKVLLSVAENDFDEWLGEIERDRQSFPQERADG